MSDYIPLKEIVRDMPIDRGEIIWLTADLTRLAIAVKRKEGTFHPDMLIELLQQKLGNDGTIVVPAFNHNLKKNDSFSLNETRPATGALALSLMGRKDFSRTHHPLHSFMVWGKWQKELTALNNKTSFGSDSPFAFLHEKGAKTLLVGTSVSKAFTFTHFVEEYCKVGYRHYKRHNIKYTDEKGVTSEKDFLIYAKRAGWNMCLQKLESLMEEKGLIHSEKINGTTISTIDLQNAFDVIREDILKNNAKNIACFSFELYLRQKVKLLARNVIQYKTVGERASI
jgi:aminoglycoside 3-N-acetyltransferase